MLEVHPSRPPVEIHLASFRCIRTVVHSAVHGGDLEVIIGRGSVLLLPANKLELETHRELYCVLWIDCDVYHNCWSHFSTPAQRLQVVSNVIEADLEGFTELQHAISDYLDANDSSKAVDL